MPPPPPSIPTSDVVTGLSLDDTFVLPGKNFAAGDTALYTAASHKIQVFAGGSVVFTFTNVTTLATATPPAFVVGSNSIEYVACFLRGTEIATADGATPVEALRIGDLVVSHDGDHRPVRWIGHRAYDRRFVAGNPQLRPVRLRAGALAPGQPRRDLLLSPLHAILVGGVLVPAVALVNGVSILREPAGSDIAYFMSSLTRLT